MLKTLPFFLIFIILFSACTKNNVIRPEVSEEEIDDSSIDEAVIPVVMHMESNQANIYEMLMIDIIENPSSAPKISDLDSIIWTVEGEKGNVDIMSRSEGSLNYTIQWGHYFYQPGTFMTYLHAYKEGEIVGIDSAEVTLTNRNDFLSINWYDDLKNTITEGYSNAGLKGYHFSILRKGKEKITSASVFVRFDSKLQSRNDAETTHEILYNYFTKLYGSPNYSSESNEIGNIYTQYFDTKLADGHPVTLWLTPKTNLAIIRTQVKAGGRYEYSVLAEPSDGNH